MRPKILLVHPFSGKAIGVDEEHIPASHSKPHVEALQKAADGDYDCEVFYISDGLKNYSLKQGKVTWRFFRARRSLKGDHKKWKKQWSNPMMNHILKNPPDLVIINMSGHVGKFSMELGRQLKQRNIPYVAMIGGRFLSYSDEHIRYYREADHILVHTRMQIAELRENDNFMDLDIRVFPLGVDIEKFSPSPEGSKTTGEKSLLYIGRLTPWKRVELCILALKECINKGMNDVTLNIVGPDSSDEYKVSLEKLASELGVTDRVNFRGFVPYDKIVDLYREASLMLLPSEHESFGMVVVESMASGLPVAVVKGTGAPDEIIESDKNGLMAPLDSYPQEVARLMADQNRLDDMSRNSRNHIVDHFSEEKTLEALINSAEKAIGKNR